MNNHIAKIIRKYLSKEACKTLIHAFVSSRIDYGNSLFYGLRKSLISRLQHMQNTAARIVTQSRRYDHITPVLYDLHWLPVCWRIKYKISLLTFKALHGTGPGYIKDLLVPYVPSRTLRSGKGHMLKIHKTKLVSCGDRCFSAIAPKLWNTLPDSIKSCSELPAFKSKLKTYFFNQHFKDEYVR